MENLIRRILRRLNWLGLHCLHMSPNLVSGLKIIIIYFQTKHTVEDKFLAQKVKVIKELGDHLTVLEKMRGDNYGLGEYVFDENL